MGNQLRSNSSATCFSKYLFSSIVVRYTVHPIIRNDKNPPCSNHSPAFWSLKLEIIIKLHPYRNHSWPILYLQYYPDINPKLIAGKNHHYPMLSMNNGHLKFALTPYMWKVASSAWICCGSPRDRSSVVSSSTVLWGELRMISLYPLPSGNLT